MVPRGWREDVSDCNIEGYAEGTVSRGEYIKQEVRVSSSVIIYT